MKHWWEGYPWRMIQTNLRQIDMADINAKEYAKQLKDFGATVVTLNAAGIIASYQTNHPYQAQSEYLTGDSLRQIIDACHEEGIRVIARTDFSKVHYDLYEQHPEWAYRTAKGEIVNYNGDVHVCPNGEYQQKIMFEILEEVLTTHPFDGVFCNMSGFLVMDYSGNFHGPCHCDSCKKKYLEIYGTEMPETDDIRNPAFIGKYMQFTGRCTAEHKARMKALVKGISEEIAMNGIDYIRSESNTEINRNEWIYSASGNSRLSAGPFHKRPADNASVDFMGFRYRHASVSPALMELRQWQNLANAGSTSIYIMGHLNNHPDVSSFEPTKKAFRFHAEHEDLFTNMVSGAEVMVIRSTNWQRADEEVYGWIRALTESHIPFDELSVNELQDAAQLAGKKCLILPGIRNLNPRQAELIDAFAQNGGTVIAAGDQAVKNGEMFLKCLGIEKVKEIRRGCMSSMFEIRESDRSSFLRCAETPFITPGAEILLMQPQEGAHTYLRLIPEHMFGPPERCYYTEVSDEPGVIAYSYGAGKGICIPFKIGSFFYKEGYCNSLSFMQDILFGLAGLREIAPGLTPMTELTLKKVGEKTLVQLVNTTGIFSNSYYPPVPVRDITLILPGKTATALNGGKLELQQNGEDLTIELDELKAYEAILIE